MKICIALVGDKHLVERLDEMIKEDTLNIQTRLVFVTLQEQLEHTLTEIEVALSICDGVLYTSPHYFKQFSKSLDHNLPTRCLDVSGNDLITGLFRESLNTNLITPLDIRNLSVDTFSRDMILASYANVGIDPVGVKIHLVQILENTFNYDKIAAQHAANYHEYGCLCVTTFRNVFTILQESNISCALAEAEKETLMSEVKSLLLLCRLKQRKNNNTVVIYTYLRAKDDFFISNENQTQEIMEINHVYELLALFSQQIDGALFTLSNNECVIVCNNQMIIEQVTSQYTEFRLIEDVNRETMFHISVGIGYGDTLLQSRQNAIIGVNNANRYGGNGAFLVYDPQHIIGPFGIPLEDNRNEKWIYDEYLTQVAKACELSINTIYRLHDIATRKRGHAFTAKELSTLMKVTPRTINRILNKLVEKSYVDVIGHHVIGERGRPSRIFCINF